MQLIIAEPKMCVCASLAMLFDLPYEAIVFDLFKDLEYPFPYPFQDYPKIPDMNVIVDWAVAYQDMALVPFEFNPLCTPHLECRPVPVWDDPVGKFKEQLRYGPGLIECKRKDGKGHMVAWDGQWVWDPTGYKYTDEDFEAHGLEAVRFWLCT